MIVDTNALSAWADGAPGVAEPLRSAERLVVPVIVIGEFTFGIRQSRHRSRYEEWLRTSLPSVEVANVTRSAVDAYADVRSELRLAGTPIPANDTWIAALARHHQLPILSNDAHFEAVREIRRIGF